MSRLVDLIGVSGAVWALSDFSGNPLSTSCVSQFRLILNLSFHNRNIRRVLSR